jgi:ERCC4-type nuclease
MYFLVIDNREKKLIDLTKDLIIDKFKVLVKPLKLGDVLIIKCSNEFDINTCSDEQLYNNCVLIFERKTCEDLLSSVNDGRYREQKARLLANFKLNQICYLIENELSTSLNKYRKNGKQIVIGAMVNKCFRDNIKMIKSKNIFETVDFLLNICKKVVSHPEYFNQLNDEETSEDLSINYNSCIKISKKENITRDSFGILSLTIIPGISINIASTIMSKYGSLNNLIKSINSSFEQHASYQNIITEIGDIQIPITGDKLRRIGSKCTQRLVEMLVG